MLNTITVPMGTQMGTDSGAGEGQGDHTQFGVVYDHLNATMYFQPNEPEPATSSA